MCAYVRKPEVSDSTTIGVVAARDGDTLLDIIMAVTEVVVVQESGYRRMLICDWARGGYRRMLIYYWTSGRLHNSGSTGERLQKNVDMRLGRRRLQKDAYIYLDIRAITE